MDRNTLSKIQNYLRLTLGSKQLKVEGRENKIDSADVTINGEFLGVIFEDKRLAGVEVRPVRIARVVFAISDCA